MKKYLEDTKNLAIFAFSCYAIYKLISILFIA